MTDLIYVGYPRKRTERTAMAEAVRMKQDWYAELGHPNVRYRALGVERRTRGVNGWVVEVERVR